MILLGKSFNVLNWEISLNLIIIIFAIIGIIVLGICIFLFFNIKNKNSKLNNGIDLIKEIKTKEKFEDLRNDFESELSKVKKIIRKV